MKLKKHPITWIPTVYFAMGMPFVALAQASSLMFKNMGISDTQITFWTSLLTSVRDKKCKKGLPN
jgi:PAT family beta-lactamase induction signal transducer AmpG